MRREAACLDAEHVAAAVGQHVLHLGVPRDAVCVGLLVHERLRVEVVHEEVRRLVHHRQLLPPAGEVEAADGGRLLYQRHRERVVHEDLHDVAVLQPHQQPLSLWRPAHHLDVADQRVEVPLALEDAVEGVQLQLPLLAEDYVVGGDDQQGAHKLLLDFLDVLVVHVQRVVVGHLVDEHLVRQLHGEAVAVHRDLLHVVLAAYANFLLCDEVLDDNVGHHVAVSVAVLIQAVHC
mmetsp:Transcript_21127/g.59379  ORF Transcript_21127/g.59379 Transcript_21127/m.59379 type:complete len:234 (+) Transcript_21127:2361-3062(+)